MFVCSSVLHLMFFGLAEKSPKLSSSSKSEKKIAFGSEIDFVGEKLIDRVDQRVYEFSQSTDGRPQLSI